MKAEENKNKHRYATVNFERSGYPRINVDLPIQYFKINSPVRHNARAVNASEGGLLVYFPEQMEIGQHLRLKEAFSGFG
jgi:hypothetical protein